MSCHSSTCPLQVINNRSNYFREVFSFPKKLKEINFKKTGCLHPHKTVNLLIKGFDYKKSLNFPTLFRLSFNNPF